MEQKKEAMPSAEVIKLDDSDEKPNGMATLTDTMEIFDTFKSAASQQEEEEDGKSSDEESFHLPLDDDELEKKEVNGKAEDENVEKSEGQNGAKNEDQNGEKIEDQNGEKIADQNGEKNEDQNVEKMEEENEEKIEDQNGEKIEVQSGEKHEDKKEPKNDDKEVEKTDDPIEIENEDVVDVKNKDVIEVKNKDNEETSGDKQEEDEDAILDKFDVNGSGDIDPSLEADLLNDIDESKANKTLTEDDADSVEKMTEEIKDDSDKVENVPETDAKKVGDDNNETVADKNSEAENNETETKDQSQDDKDKKKDITELETTNEGEEEMETEDADVTLTEENIEEIENTNEEKENNEEKMETSEISPKIIEVETVEEKSETAAEKTEETADKRNEQSIDKSEISNDSSKSNGDADDLLDISVIRDIDEDNANAAEDVANEQIISEKSSNADETSCDKPESDSDVEMENENEEQMQSEKDEEMRMEFEDDTTRDTGKPEEEPISVSDDNKDASEYDTNDVGSTVSRDIESESVDDSGDKKSDSGVGSSLDEQTVKQNIKEEPSINGKRSLSEEDTSPTASKKMKLSEDTAAVVVEEVKKPIILRSFASFMKGKKLGDKKLTRADLEQFCLQKICESILHKTDVGEMHQKLQKYEATIETLRKDVQQLSKQARDLEIVNKKLMSELKTQNGNKKPLVPLKITRSVGLQVKTNGIVDPRRRSTQITPQKHIATTPVGRGRSVPVGNVVRQVQKTPTPTKTTPILSQALQSRRAQVTPPTKTLNPRPLPPARAKDTTEAAKPKPNASVIDLTDEDDKKTAGKVVKSVPLNQVKTVTVSQNKTISVGPNKTVMVNQTKTIPLNQAKSAAGTRAVTTLSQGMRLTTSQLKNGSITLPGVVTSNAPLMYVVQPTQGLVTTTAGGTQKAVIVNFQPTTNGVLASSLNGSTVSVIPKNKVQIKQAPSNNKHPAPLPTPPMVKVNSAVPLKPRPPKPHLSIRKTDTGIILQWKMPYNLDLFETIASYQLYAYQETSAPPDTNMWRRVGDVKALALPMACTLTQFADKNKYYFAVRSVDVHKRIGSFSDPEEISL